MGVCVEQRDEPMNALPPKPSATSSGEDYHLERLLKSRELLKGVASLSPEEIEEKAEAAYQASRSYFHERQARSLRDKTRYEAMLEQVRSWSPPTSDHSMFKEFMASQIEDSVKNDCGWLDDDQSWSKPPVKRSPEEWHREEIRALVDRSEYHERHLGKAREVHAERNAWLEAFWAALPPEEAS